ncbi:hypothetical protein BCR34DRAFT_553164 [Clohesyomyces aquaticus]|uniref:Uncharacterized protein n=1 Tax=Clohesyomyces aquaticus TaxID=1231657 RepID=A0A1Y2A994_9PLEO|nr:hypothetical protein BCR34DRAFT_553164 [Clohesyomyces aquaticus]
MCYHNYTRHTGCGHLGESHAQPWTLCPAAEQRLLDLRGPMSPPPTSSMAPPPLPPKRTSTNTSSASGSKLHKRIASFSASITRTASTSSDRRAISGPAGSRTSTSSFNSPSLGFGIADHELGIVLCKSDTVIRRTQISQGMQMDVCKECGKWIREMRFMLDRFERTGSVMGTSAFEEFLKYRGESVEGFEGIEGGLVQQQDMVDKAVSGALADRGEGEWWEAR